MTAGLRLAPDTHLLLDGEPYVVAAVDPTAQAVTLCDSDGEVVVVALGWLLDHPGLESPDEQQGRPAGAVVSGAPRHALSKAQKRLQHVLEVETGHKSGDPDDGVACDLRYDPALVPSVIERRTAKARELAQPAVDRDQRMSYRTLEREAKEWRDRKPENLVDGRSCREVLGTRVKPEVLDAIEEVVAERKNRSNFQTLDAMANLVAERVKRDHPEQWPSLLPGNNKTIIRAAQVMYTPAELTKGKAKYRRTKLDKTGRPAARLVCTRPGQIVMGDAKDLDVLLANTVFEGWVRGRLIMWMDVYSCSIPEVRIVLESEKAVDISQSIISMGRPKLMEPGWEDALRWPFVGVPEHLVSDLAGGAVAGVPFMDPEHLVVDNGRPYRAFANVATARRLGTSIVPARRMRATDKARIERSFRTLDTQLCQYLRGYRGPDSSERGADVEGEVRYTDRDLEAIIRHWVASIWQRNGLNADIRPPWCPADKAYSPNQMFNYGIQQTGLKLRFLAPQEYASALPVTSLKLHGTGFKVKGLWYDIQPQDGPDGRPLVDPLGPWRKPDRRTTPDWARKHEVAYDPRDMRHVWWLHPTTGKYVRLAWRGGFGQDDMPVFNDKDVAAVVAIAGERRLDPLDGPALAQALFALLKHHDPRWNEDLPSKRERQAAARRQQQGDSAARDRAAGMADETVPDEEAAESVAVSAREQHERLVAEHRRAARHAAGVVGGTAPAALGSGGGGLFDGLDDPPAAEHQADRAPAPVIQIRRTENSS